MDALKAEIATKRKPVLDNSTRPTKYMRRGDIERLKEEQEQKAQEEKERLTASTAAATNVKKVSLQPKISSLCTSQPSMEKIGPSSFRIRITISRVYTFGFT
jgi:pre-mRNA-splicing factor 18